MARRPFVAGNWKLNLGPAAAGALARGLRERLADHGEVTVAVFPTALSIPTVVAELAGSDLAVGVQEIEAKASGAFTGANSAVIAREVGCTHALVGHSERRQLWGETDAGCAAKLVAALGAGLLPIYCVGETLAERRAGRVEGVVFRQLADGLGALAPDQVGALTLAYEPVWAIGTGENATPDQAQAVHAAIRGWLRSRYGAGIADDVRIQYGGSVKADNARDLLSCPDIDGALVGGASLDAAGFAAIVAAAR
ncbi:MAG: triose-phosphate isomerase [Myxococcota bacterium]